MVDALKKFVRSRVHRERAQPEARNKYGLLEKHKDYVARAKDFHKKQDKIKLLQTKAAMRNPDEFYFGMIKSKTKDGVHVIERENKRPQKKLKKMKAEDSAYLTVRMEEESKKIEKLKNTLHFASTERPTHVIFTEDPDSFDPVEYFETDPDLVDSFRNRPRKTTLFTSAAGNVNVDIQEVAKSSKKSYTELQARQDRLGKISSELNKVNRDRLLMGKGSKKKIELEDGSVSFKWKSERKK